MASRRRGLRAATEDLLREADPAVACVDPAPLPPAQRALLRQLDEAETQIEGARRPAAAAAGYRAARLAITRFHRAASRRDERRGALVADRLDRLADNLSTAATLATRGRLGEAQRHVDQDLRR